MRPSLSGRSHSLYRAATALYSAATALYRSSTAFCRYAGSTAGFVHILGPHLSTVLGALLPLHYSSIAAPLRRRPRVQIRPFCTRRRPNRSSRVQIIGFCPRRWIYVCRYGPFAPVVVQIDLHGCKLWVSAPVVVHWCCPELRQEPAYLNPPNPLFKGAHQGLRAFHRRSAALPANSGPASEDAFPEEFRLRSTLR